jgi:hypothetical protein
MISSATIETDRPARYLTQLCRHAAAMSGGPHAPMSDGSHAANAGGHGPHAAAQVQVEQSDNRAVLRFVHWGQCVIEAGRTTLTLRVEAVDEPALRRIQDIVAADLTRFGRRDQLALTWRAGSADPFP